MGNQKHLRKSKKAANEKFLDFSRFGLLYNFNSKEKLGGLGFGYIPCILRPVPSLRCSVGRQTLLTGHLLLEVQSENGRRLEVPLAA